MGMAWRLGLWLALPLALLATLVAADSAAAAIPAQTDVMFLFDTSGSMSGALEEAKSEIAATMSRLNASLPNVEYGVAEVRDYSPSIYSEEIAEEVEPGVPVRPWTLDQPITADAGSVEAAIAKLVATDGGDAPEAYGRALWETDTNPAVGWRPGARHLMVLVADQVPHNPNLNEGIPEEFWAQPSPWNTGEELPGSWGIPDTTLKEGETLDFHAVLRQLATDGKPLEMVDYHDTEGDYVHYWEAWAKIAGGGAVEAGEASKELAGKLIPIIEGGATTELPPCPVGQVRDVSSSECVTPPAPTSDEGLGAPTPTCANHSVTLAGSITVEASCFRVNGDGTLSATGHIRVNGLDVVTSGSGGFTLDLKKLALSASGVVDVYAGSLHIYHGSFSWDFTKKLSLGVPKGLKIKGLPVGGEITVSLTSGGVQAVANATIGKAPYEVSGAINLKLLLDTGLQLSSFKLELASDLPIKSLVVHKASLSYDHSSAGDEWKGAVEVELPAKGPTVAGDLTVVNGSINEVALNVSKINKPLGEVVFLQSLGLKVDFVPKLSATGSIGLSAGPAVSGHTAASLSGSLTAEIGDPFVLEAKGSLSLVEDKVADATVKAKIPGGISFKGKISASFLVIHLEGDLSGEITSKSFSAEGGVTIKAPVVSAQGDGLVNNVGLAGCASAQIGVTVFGNFIGTTVTIGGSHRWSGENSLFDDSCGFGRLRSALGASSARLSGAVARVQVPPHTSQINLIVRGAGTPPQVALAERGASALVSPESVGALGRAVYLAIGVPSEHETDIAIAKPAAGSIEVAAAPGQPALEGVSSSLPLPHPNVRVKLKRAGGRRYKLSWSARRIAGQTLIFEDLDGRGQVRLLTTTRSRGSHEFTAPDDGSSGSQRLRTVVEQDGLVRETLQGPRFQPAPVRLSRPRVHVSLRGGFATVRWDGVSNAAGYQIWIATSDGRRLFFARGRQARSLRLTGARRVSASVRAVGAGLELGPPGRAQGVRRRRHARRHG